MNRDELLNLLPVHADGELDERQAAAIEAELERSPELRAEVERWKTLRKCCNRVACCGAAPAGMENRVRSGLVSQQRMLSIRQFFTYSSLAAAAVFVAAMFWPTVATPGRAPVQASLASAEPFVRIYERCAKHHHDTMHLTSSCPVNATGLVKKVLCDQKRECPVFVPDLRPDGFELDGICQCFPAKDRPPGMMVVHAFYRRPADASRPEAVLSVFSTSYTLKVQGCGGHSGQCGTRRQYESGKFDGVTLVKWDERGGGFALCAELPEATLEGLAEKVRTAANWNSAPPVASIAK